MVNRNMMLDEDFEDELEKEPYAPEPNDEDELFNNIYQGVMELGNTPFLFDPFNFSNINEKDSEDEELDELIDFLESEDEKVEEPGNTIYTADIKLSEDTQNRLFDIIDGCRDVLNAFSEGMSTVKDDENDEDDQNSVKVKEPEVVKSTGEIKDVIVSTPRRKYTNVAQFERAKFGQVEDADPPILPKLIAALVITLVTGTVFGVMANSYYIANQSDELTAFKCAFAWLGDTPPVSLSPLYADVFFTGFGVIAVVLAAVFLLIWDNSTQKRARREGKEHGNARFATMSDYKKYRQRHMDTKG